MDSIIKISNVSDLKPFKSAWRVHVKVLHLWNSVHPTNGSTIEMVLTDDNGVKIQASCKQELFERLQMHLRVGKWKFISYFALRRASCLYKHTSHEYKIDFVSHTSITDSNHVCDDMFLDLHDFASITDGSRDRNLLFDVIGEVLDYGGLDIVQCERKEVAKLEFTLRDINDKRMHCCIYGKSAQMLTQDDKQPNNGDVCLIRYARIGDYKGQLTISNAFDTSNVSINPDIKEARSLKQKFVGENNSHKMYQEKNAKIVIQENRMKWSHIPFKTIQEIKYTEKDEKCRVVSTVYAIDTENGWYYLACVVCNKKVFERNVIFHELDMPSWRCEFCHLDVTKVSPRYSLDLLVQDQTGESKFTLLDSVAQSIVQNSAANVLEVLGHEIANPDILPPELVEIVGKTFGFGISVANVGNFSAMKVWSLKDIMWKRIKSLHRMSTYSRKKQCKNVMNIGEKNNEEDDEEKSG